MEHKEDNKRKHCTFRKFRSHPLTENWHSSAPIIALLVKFTQLVFYEHTLVHVGCPFSCGCLLSRFYDIPWDKRFTIHAIFPVTADLVSSGQYEGKFQPSFSWSGLNGTRHTSSSCMLKTGRRNFIMYTVTERCE